MLQRQPAPAVMRRVLLALLATAACLAQLARAQRGQVPSPPEECSDKIRKATKWGVATAAYQIEGAWNVGGRTPSVWDVFAHTPGNIKDGSNGDVACDHYNRYKEDFALMASMGIKHYLFSISWNRVLPEGGRGSPVNAEGVAFYNRLLDAMEAAGIEPAATMFHWDLPQVLHDKYKGPLSPEFVDDFEHYADALFSSFPRIKNWMTFNEPLITCDTSYGVGKFAPGYKGGTAGTYACAHNVLLAHARVKALSKKRYAKLRHKIGIALNVEWAEPMTDSAEDRAAAQRNLDVQFGVFADPLFLGHYPPLLKEKFGGDIVKDFTKEQSALLKGSADFLGINFYTAKYVRGNGHPHGYVVSNWSKNGRAIGPLAASSWLRVVPEGIYKVTQYASRRYGRPEIRITENGVSVPGEAEMTLDRALRDDFRVNYYRNYLKALCKSKAEGARVTHYYAWSFMDNFEWRQGYTERFGVVAVDFNNGTLARTVKDSGRFLSEHFFKESA